MRYKISYSVQAQLVDQRRTVVSAEPLIRKLHGLACVSDNALNYAELSFGPDCQLRGGYPRLVVDDRGRLTWGVEFDSTRKLSRNELKELREDLEGQLTDGIGSSCFDDLTLATGLAAVVQFPIKTKCTQSEGTAWRPTVSPAKGNEKRIAAVAKLVDKMNSSPPAPRVSKKSVAHGAGINVSSVKENGTQANLEKLFRLLAKPERDTLFDEIKLELERCGNDLSGVVDRQYPPGNFNDPKLLRMLLKAGLPPETTDSRGGSLLSQAVPNPKCLELLLQKGVDVNHACEDRIATSLMRAASLGKLKSVELLLTHGADPTIKNRFGKSAEDLVDKRARDREKIVDLLRSASKKQNRAKPRTPNC